MRKHALKYRRDDGTGDGQLISNKSCQTDILGLDKYLQRSPPLEDTNNPNSAALQRTYKRQPKKPKVRSVAVHCERRRLTLAAFKGCQKFKHVYKRKISLPQPSSSIPTATCSSTSADDGQRNGGVLPKLRPDRATEIERPAAAKTEPTVKLPRIPRTRDLKPEPDRTDDGDAGSGTRLAKLIRPQSTGSSNGGTGTSDDRKLAYFRARSAPKVNSRFNTRSDPSRPLLQPRSPRECEQSTTPGSSDTADTTLDMSFVRQKLPDNATAATVAGTNSTTKTVSTATVSTSTSFTEPIFPIVFSCESVLRHPLDGGYVSHTESHRFSVHYVPVKDAKAVVTTDTENGSRSSLEFTSASGCKNKRCLTDDSISVTLSSKPDDSAVSQFAPLSTSTSTSNTIGERRLVIEHLDTDVQLKNIPDNVGVSGETIVKAITSPADCHSSADENPRLHQPHPVETSRDDETNGTQIQKIESNVLEKNNAMVNKDTHVFAKVIVPPMPANKIIDDFGDDGEEEGTAMPFESPACTDVMLLQPDEQNYERLTQNHQVVDSGRTVSNQSPKPDGTAKRLGIVERQNNLKPVEDDNVHAIDILSNTQSTANVELTKPSTDSKLVKHSVIDELTKQSTNDDPVQKQNDSNYLDHLHANLEDMACKQHCCSELLIEKHRTERNRTNIYEPTTLNNTDDRPTRLDNMRHYESTDKHFSNRCNVPPNQLQDEMSRKRDENRDGHTNQNPYHIFSHLQSATTHLNTRHRHDKSNRQSEIFDDDNIVHSQCHMNNAMPKNSVNNQYCGQLEEQTNNLTNGKRGGRSNIDSCEYDRLGLRMTKQREQCGLDMRQRANPHVHVEHVDTNACHRCTNNSSCEKNEVRNSVENLHYNIDHNMNHSKNSYGDGKCPLSKYRLKSVDESAESSKVSNNYIGGFLFGDEFYNRKRPEKYEADNERDGRLQYGYYDDAKKVNFSSRPNNHYEYYQDYAPKTRYSPRDEDCTVFANMPLHNSGDGGNKTHGVRHDRYTSMATEPLQTSYYSKLDSKVPYRVDDKNTDSDESLTDSLEDGKYEGAAVSYFLALDGQKSAVTFTFKMPNTLESRLNRRQSQLKKHLHMSTTVTKKHASTRVRSRHKSCQTLWTEEKGVQVQRGSTANATRKPVDDHKVFETLLAGLERHRVSENQIRVVGGQKMVSEGNQTEQLASGLSNRQTQTRAMTQEVGVGPRTPENSTGLTLGRKNKGQQHTMHKFSSDNALMVGVVKQNKYKDKESLDDEAKNNQVLTLSKGWINLYTIGADSGDTDVQGS